MATPFILSDTSPDDLKRLVSAKAIKPKKFRIDVDKGVGVFIGSHYDEYDVTLKTCTCMDFQVRMRARPNRALPCKHMIRLAMEMGYDFPMPMFDPTAAVEYDMSDDIDNLKKRWLAGQLTTDAYIACLAAFKKSAEFAMKAVE